MRLLGRGGRFGLALGGGAARGLAHLGVLEVLEERGLRPAALSGTSVGALIAGIWLTSENAERAIDKVQEFVRSDDYHRAELEYVSEAKSAEPAGWASLIMRSVSRGVFYTRAFRNISFVSDENYRHNVFHLLPDVAIESLPLPFSAVATDLATGQPVVFRRGPLREAVLASGAVPGVMPPQRIHDRLLSDGAMVDKIPARALLATEVDVIVGVDVSSAFDESAELKRGLEVITRANQITEWSLRRVRAALCDVVVRPSVQDIRWLDFAGAMPAIGRGRDAMERELPRLRDALRGARLASLVGLSRTRKARRLLRDGWLGGLPVEH